MRAQSGAGTRTKSPLRDEATPALELSRVGHVAAEFERLANRATWPGLRKACLDYRSSKIFGRYPTKNRKMKKPMSEL